MYGVSGGYIPPRATSKKQTGLSNDAVAMTCRARLCGRAVGMRLFAFCGGIDSTWQIPVLI